EKNQFYAFVICGFKENVRNRMSEIVSQFPSLFSGSESEDNWQSRDRAMAALTEALSTSADAGEVVGLNLKIVLDSVLKS
ncbi:hypothetical protein HDU99_007085, partial [Rhizoclosmatium hyalinum]